MDARVALGKPDPPEADDDFQAALAKVDDPSPDLTAPGVSFIGHAEVAGPAEYRKRYSHAVWPTKESGITIGIGCELSAVSKTMLASDWATFVRQDALDRLAPGRRAGDSQASRERLRHRDSPSVRILRLPEAHDSGSCEEHAHGLSDARRSPPARRTALISLVFNRGSDLDGDRRREMKAIRDLLEAGKPEQVADQFDAMERLCDPATDGGVIKRRHRAATLWRSGFEDLQLA